MGKTVCTTTKDLVFGTQPLGKAFKDHSGVIIKTPCNRRVYLVRDTRCVEDGKHLPNPCSLRNLSNDCKNIFKRPGTTQPDEGITQVVPSDIAEVCYCGFFLTLVKKCPDLLFISIGKICKEGTHEGEMADAEDKRYSCRPEKVISERDNLRIPHGRVCPDKFCPELPELAVSSLLWSLISETVGKIAPFDGFVERSPLFNIHPENRCGQFRPECKRPATLVLKHVHLIDDPLS